MKPIDLRQIRAEFYGYIDALAQENAPYGAFKGGKDRPCDLYASLDMALLRGIMGEDLLDFPRRDEWVQYIRSGFDHEKKDGSVAQRFTHHSTLHANGMVIGALGLLGGKMPYENRLYDPFCCPDSVERWLEAIDWRDQWTQSHLFWGGMHCFSLSARCQDEWLRRVFAWLDENLDAETGFWKRGVTHYNDRHQQLGGFVHIYPIYAHKNRAFPYPKRVIDSVLAMQLPTHEWLLQEGGHGMSYMDMDALFALRQMTLLAPAYRAEDVAAAVLRYGMAVTERFMALLPRLCEVHPHYVLAMAGCFGLLQQLLPAVWVDDAVWTDIFSDPKLYRVRETEIIRQPN